MDITTMKSNAVVCVASARLRTAGPNLLADGGHLGKGAAVSAAVSAAGLVMGFGAGFDASVRLAPIARVEALEAPFAGVVSGATIAYQTSDVARSLYGRPPV